MKSISYQRIYLSQEYLATLGDIRSRALFGGYSLSVDDVVFAMVANGELYLRMCEESASYTVKRQSPLLTYKKRGRQVSLNYYFVDEHLWHDRAMLVRLSSYSLNAARSEAQQKRAVLRLKDLPNLTFQLETLLCEAGVRDPTMLRMLGAKACWLRMKKRNKNLGVKVLLALEGAIFGMHEAALPACRRKELIDWFNTLDSKAWEPR
ncbi:TfoX/Sxy family DNA transformation protein [Yokenella regensburgei]|uniref:TfoX/Sxy family DNA transformation protein n=1 Tax=Yokenella regensburgei TaxID=158877 RepID=UPI003F17E5A4